MLGSDTTSSTKNIQRAIECIENGHGRVEEYVDVEMIIDEYSARVIREWYTHRQGNTNLQESTRYINMDNFQYFIPPKIKNNPSALALYENCMDTIKDTYNQLIKLDIPKEDAGNVLPLGSHTKIVAKFNLRALIHMYEMRECTRAYHEFRQLLKELKEELRKLDSDWVYICDNFLVPKCYKLKYCPEKYSCGKYKQIK